MGQKEDPDFTFRVVVVQAIWPGSSIQEMEDQVVNKIERKLQETPHLDFVRSFTRAGSAIITVQIKGDTNAAEVADAFYQVRKKVGDISGDLPQGLLGPYFNDEFGDTFITLHSISGDGFSYPELKKFAIQARDMPASASATPEPSTIGVASIPLRPSTPWKVKGTRMNKSMPNFVATTTSSRREPSDRPSSSSLAPTP